MMDSAKYRVYSSVFMMNSHELYSGGEDDPIVISRCAAEDILAFSKDGKKLPYSISCSIFAQEFDRDGMLLEDLGKSQMRWMSKIAVHIIIFNNTEDKEEYENSNNTIIESL